MNATTDSIFVKMCSSKLLKTMSIVIVACMPIALTACGAAPQKDPGQTTTEYRTEEFRSEEFRSEEFRSEEKQTKEYQTKEYRPEEHEDINDPNDPEQPIDDGFWHEDTANEPDSAEEPTTSKPGSQRNGTYSYTIYNNIPIRMDVNIDDYIKTNKAGMLVFKYGSLMEDYGWTCTDEAEHTYAYYYEDMAIVMSLHNYPYYKDRINFNGDTDSDYFQVRYVHYFLTAQDNFSVPYSNSSDPIGLGARIELLRHPDDCIYLIAPSISSVGSKDDMILLAYLISSVSRNPGRNPFYNNSDFANYEDGKATGVIVYKLP